eukprot:6184289-Prymnesium_polylepis.1
MAITGLAYQCVDASAPYRLEVTTVPSCEHEPTNSPVLSTLTQLTRAECGVKRRISFPLTSSTCTPPACVPSARKRECTARQVAESDLRRLAASAPSRWYLSIGSGSSSSSSTASSAASACSASVCGSDVSSASSFVA